MVETECTAAKIAAMMRAIDASKSRNEIDKALENAMKGRQPGPLLDAVSVVRCKDCKQLQRCNFTQFLGLDGYCSYGDYIGGADNG